MATATREAQQREHPYPYPFTDTRGENVNRFGFELRRHQAAEGQVRAATAEDARARIEELIGDDDIDWDTDLPEIDVFDFGPDDD